jgi:flagellar hook-associated protein 1 FlgK
MSDLMSLLGLGSAGIAAQNSGVAVASNNVANANTEGYSRQRVDLESVLGPPLEGGVRAGDAQRYASNLLASRIRTASGSLQMSQASADALSDLEASLTSGATIDGKIAALFSRLSQVAATPTDSVARDAVVNAANETVTNIHDKATAITDAQHAANSRIVDNAAQATLLAKQLADANKAVARTGDPVAADRRDLLAKQLSDLTGGSARIDRDGQLRFVLSGGAVLVDGTHAASLQTTPDPTTGLAKVEVVDGNSRRDVTGAIDSGKLAADLTFRDVTATRAMSQLDQLAYDLATSMNTVHSANAALDGTTGHAMFVAPAAVTGAAAALAVDPTLAADSANLAVAAPGTGPGDNKGALALFALANQNVASGGTKTLTDAAIEMIGAVGTEGAAAQGDVARDTMVSDHLAGLRDSLAGVDTQEELTNLARFEHASSAMTKFVSTIDGMLSSLIENL